MVKILWKIKETGLRIKETLEFHKQIMLTASLKERAKGNVRQCHTCSLYNQIPLPAGSNPRGTKRNHIWQLGAFHFENLGNKGIHTIPLT